MIVRSGLQQWDFDDVEELGLVIVGIDALPGLQLASGTFADGTNPIAESAVWQNFAAGYTAACDFERVGEGDDFFGVSHVQRYPVADGDRGYRGFNKCQSLYFAANEPRGLSWDHGQ